MALRGLLVFDVLVTTSAKLFGHDVRTCLLTYIRKDR